MGVASGSGLYFIAFNQRLQRLYQFSPLDRCLNLDTRGSEIPARFATSASGRFAARRNKYTTALYACTLLRAIRQ
jgi:hypothetical protein